MGYWMIKEKIELDHLLVIVDDIALPFGHIRIRPKGADGGHNGLKSINNLLGSQQWARLRFGVGNDFPPGAQVDYVLGYPTPEELAILPERAKVAVDAIKACVADCIAQATGAEIEEPAPTGVKGRVEGYAGPGDWLGTAPEDPAEYTDAGTYDVIVLGGGHSGIAAAFGAVDEGATWLLSKSKMAPSFWRPMTWVSSLRLPILSPPGLGM